MLIGSSNCRRASRAASAASSTPSPSLRKASQSSSMTIVSRGAVEASASIAT